MGFRMLGFFALLQAVILLTVSYFVLVSTRKLEKEQGLKVFGYTIAALLWVCALFIFSAGAYKIMKPGKNCPMMKGSMRGMMQGPMKGMSQGVMDQK